MIIVTRTRRVDWQRIVGNLQKTGMSLQQIADAIDVGRTSVYGYMADELAAEPPFWVGARLLVLWAERVGCKWTDAPTREVERSVSKMLAEMR